MADEIRVTREGEGTVSAPRPGAHTHPGEIEAHADVEAVIPPHDPDVIQTDDPVVARAAIEQTRARMSETIDEIEEKLVRKKEEIQEKLDVFGPVRERPFAAAGAVFGAGLLLGFLTGGDDEDDDRYEEREYEGRGRYRDAEERAELWEHRARRLLRIAQEQEDELEDLRGERVPVRHDWSEEGERYEEDEDEEEEVSALDRLQHTLAERIGDYVSDAFRTVFSGPVGV